MSDEYRIDSHKLMLHPDRVARWLGGEDIYPIYVELSPSGICNHRCDFCAYDYVGYKAGLMDADVLIERLTEMGRLGVKSVLYSGEGEPLLNKRIDEIVKAGTAAGIDQAMASNGVMLTRERADALLPHLTWLKISIAGGTPATYMKVQGAREGDFEKVIENMTYAAESRRAGRHECTLGMQLLLVPDNAGEVMELGRIARDIGMDYLVVKPYSQHPLSVTDTYKDVRYSDYLDLADELETLADENFSVVMRVRTMQKWDEGTRPYAHCNALPFWAHIATSGDVWGCPAHLGDDRFLYGNIFENTFEEIWKGDRRRASLEFVEHELGTAQCRVNCRMDEVNRYLWELKNPSGHVNFI